MDYHHHARKTVHGRELLCRDVLEGRLGVCEAAAEHRLSRQSVRKWVQRYRQGGRAALSDRSSRPHRLRQPTSGELVAEVERLRRQRQTGIQIAQQTGLSRATVSRILARLGLNRIKMLEPAVPVLRYEHPQAGDLLHIDIKKLARIVKPGHRITGNPRDETRGAGWEFLYVAIDDHSRLAYTAMYPNEKAVSSIDFLQRATAWFQRFGISVRGVLTDNGPCFYRLQFGGACRQLNIQHRRTRPYRPQTNGKAERFIQTALREWAYAQRYQSSAQRLAHLQPWTHRYNWHRPHASLNQLPPISRAGLDGNNLLTHHI
jgi:transposase InsO family protein